MHNFMITRRLHAPASPARIGSVYYLFFWGMFAVYIPYFHVYLTELGLTGVQIGLVAAIFPLMTLTVAPIASALADQRGWRRRSLRIGFIGWIVVMLLYRFPTSFLGIFVLVFFEALVRSPLVPIGDSIIARMGSTHNVSFGSMRLWGSLAFAVVAIVGGLVWEQIGYKPMFVVTAVAILPCLFLTRYLPDNRPIVTNKSRRPPRQLFSDPALLTLFIGALLVGAGLFAASLFGGIYMAQLGGSKLEIGLLFGLSALIEVPIMQSSDWLMRRFRGDRVLLFGYIATALSFMIYAIAWSPWTLIFAAIIKGVGYALFFVVTVHLIDSRVPEEWVSTAQSVFAACFIGLAPLLTTTLSGYILDNWGAGSLFGILTAVVLIGSGVLAFASHRGWFNQTINWKT